MPEQKIPFLTLFSAWQPEEELAALAAGCTVTGAVIDRAARSISARVECPSLPADDLRRRWERSLADTYRAGRVVLELLRPQSEAPAAAEHRPEPVPEPPVEQASPARGAGVSRCGAVVPAPGARPAGDRGRGGLPPH